MSRIIPLILIVICVFLWYRSRRSTDRVLASMVPAAPGEQSARSRELGLLPPDELDTTRAAPQAPELSQALTAAGTGDWHPAAALLGSTAADRELRWLYVQELATAAAADDAWLSTWEKAEDKSADAAVVRAATTRTDADIARAKELDPADPTPYVVELGTADADVDGIWPELRARAPHHFGAHLAAPGYAPAAHEAAQAPPGTLMSAFPLLVWYEEHQDAPADTEELRSLTDHALMDAAAAPTTHPHLPELRHLLAYFLYRQSRYDAALEQFRLVDGHVNALPWNNGNTLRRYLTAREETVQKAHTTSPAQRPTAG